MSEITFFKSYEENQQEGALCIITETHGSTPRKKVGSKMLVFPNGKIIGSIGGGRLEKKVIEDAIGVLESGQARVNLIIP